MMHADSSSHNGHDSVHDLPFELLQQIAFQLRKLTTFNSSIVDADSVQTMSQVCSTWRAALLGARELWSSVDLTWPPPRAHLWMERSRGHPMSFSFHYPIDTSQSPTAHVASYPNELFRRLNGQRDQPCTLLDISIPDRHIFLASWMILRRQDFTHLKNLQIDHRPPPESQNSTRFSNSLYAGPSICFPKLHILCLRNVSITFAGEIPKLTSLTLVEYPCGYDELVTLLRACKDTLQYLNITRGMERWGATPQFPSIAHFDLPELRQLDLIDAGNQILRLFAIGNRIGFPNAEVLSISFTNQHVDYFYYLLPLLPSFKVLRLDDTSNFSDILLFLLISPGTVCPEEISIISIPSLTVADVDPVPASRASTNVRTVQFEHYRSHLFQLVEARSPRCQTATKPQPGKHSSLSTATGSLLRIRIARPCGLEHRERAWLCQNLEDVKIGRQNDIGVW